MEILEHIFVALAYVAVIGFLINGLDDLFFDVGFLHFLWRSRKDRHLTLQDLKLVPEQWIALFVPAWQEGGVVNKMAEYASRICIYERYDISSASIRTIPKQSSASTNFPPSIPAFIKSSSRTLAQPAKPIASIGSTKRCA